MARSDEPAAIALRVHPAGECEDPTRVLRVVKDGGRVQSQLGAGELSEQSHGRRSAKPTPRCSTGQTEAVIRAWLKHARAVQRRLPAVDRVAARPCEESRDPLVGVSQAGDQQADHHDKSREGGRSTHAGIVPPPPQGASMLRLELNHTTGSLRSAMPPRPTVASSFAAGSAWPRGRAGGGWKARSRLRSAAARGMPMATTAARTLPSSPLVSHRRGGCLRSSGCANSGGRRRRSRVRLSRCLRAKVESGWHESWVRVGCWCYFSRSCSSAKRVAPARVLTPVFW